MSEEQLDILIKDFQKDTNLMKLLRTLSPQLELLVKHGFTDLRRFYEDLEKENLGLGDDDKLRELFALEDVSDECTIPDLTDLITPGCAIR
jgi:hypothetical protein